MPSLSEFNSQGNNAPSYDEFYEYGWFRLPRRLFDDALLRNSKNLAVWCWLRSRAIIPEKSGKCSVVIDGKPVWLQHGQLSCGAKMIASDTGVNEKTVWSILNKFISAGVIEKRGTNQFSLITLKESHLFSRNEKRDEKQSRAKEVSDEDIYKNNRTIKDIDDSLKRKIEQWLKKMGIRSPDKYLANLQKQKVTGDDIRKSWREMERAPDPSPALFYGRALEIAQVRVGKNSSPI